MLNINYQIKQRREGQSLIVVLMLAALISTIVGTVAFQSATQTSTTNTTTQQEIAEKGAQGILEKILNNESINVSEDLGTNLNPSITPVFSNAVGAANFVTTNTVSKDSQYLFYLSGYDPTTNAYAAPNFSSNFTIYFDSDTDVATCPVLELTYVSVSGTPAVVTILKREATGACGSNTVGVSTSLGLGATIDGVTFARSWAVNTGASPIASSNLLIVRPLFNDTKLGFSAASGNLPAQGQTITAVVQTAQGTQKEEQVYRPYPQINDLPIFLSIF